MWGHLVVPEPLEKDVEHRSLKEQEIRRTEGRIYH